LALAPKNVNARTGRARARAALGEHALALADFDAAARAHGAPIHDVGRSASLASLGRLDEAVRAVSRAITAAPDDAGAHYLRAVYRSHVDPEDPGVRADLDRAVELAPHEAIYLRARAKNRMNAEEYDLAVADFDLLASLRPDDATIHYLRGKCLTDCDEGSVIKRQAALVSLERALELAPKDGELRRDILYAIVCAWEGLPDPDAHLAALDRAIVEMPTEAPLLHVRADRRRRRGDLAGAASDLARLRELGIDLERR
jgi:tetratricopeptide (TPR) repeat protein